MVFEARFFEIFPELPEANTPRWTSPTSHWSCPAFTLQVLQHMDGTTAVPPAALSMASGGAMTFPRWRMVILWVCLSHDIDKGNEVLTDPWALNPCIFRGHIGYVSIVIPGNWLGLKKGSSIIWVCSANEMSAGTLHELCTESFGNLSLAGRTKVLPVLNGSSRHLSRIDKNESST